MRYQKIIKNQEDNIDMLLEQNVKLASKIDNMSGMTNYERMFWFGLGIAAAGFAVYGAASLARSQ